MKKDLTNFQAPDPEEYWGKAEKMLDQHFSQKRKRKRLAIFFIAIAGMIGSAYLFTNVLNPDSAKKMVKTDIEKRIPNSNQITGSVIETPQAGQPDASQENQDLNNSSIKPFSKEEKTSAESDKTPKNKTLKTEAVQYSNSSAKTPLKTGATKDSELDKIDNSGYNSSLANKRNNSQQNKKIPAGASATEGQNNLAEQRIIPSFQEADISTATFSNRIENLIGSNKLLDEGNSKEKFLLNTSPLNIPEPTESPQKSKLALTFYASAHSVSKSIKTVEADHYLERREQEEKNMIAPALGLSLSWIKNNFSAAAGIEYSYLGEKIAYGSYSRQEVYTHSGNWQTFNIWVTDTDTAYISGLRWFLETQVNQLDSQYVSHTDTSFVKVQDKKLSEQNGINKFYYVEIPLELRYQFPLKRFAFGISVGVAPAWLTSEKGYYISKDQSGLEQVSVTKPIKTFFVNGSLGLDVNYMLKPGINLFVGPQFKTNLGTITKSEFHASQRYTKMGVKLGITYQIR